MRAERNVHSAADDVGASAGLDEMTSVVHGDIVARLGVVDAVAGGEGDLGDAHFFSGVAEVAGGGRFGSKEGGE